MSDEYGATWGWSGWYEGEDVTPEEPGKEWLAIEHYGEEFAIIVLRTDASIFVDNDDALADARHEREECAQLIVDALIAHGPANHSLEG